MQNIYTRIQEVLKTQNAAKIGRILEYDKSNIYKWRDGKAAPTVKTLLQIYEMTNCSLHWLLTGEGEKYVTEDSPNVPKKLALEPGSVDTSLATPNAPIIPESELPTKLHRIETVPVTGLLSGQQLQQQEGLVQVQLPEGLLQSGMILIRIEGEDLSAEGLHDSDLVIADALKDGEDPEGKIVIAEVGGLTVIRHYSTAGKLAVLAPIDGPRPSIKAGKTQVRIRYIARSVTTTFR